MRKTCFLLLGLGLALAACAVPPQPLEPALTPSLPLAQSTRIQPTFTPTPGLPTSPTPIPSTKRPTATPRPTKTGRPVPATAWAPLSLAQPALAYIGETPASGGEAIGAGNYRRLAHVAQWGRGVILDVAFAPDGRTFAVGSPFGVGIYDRTAPGEPPRWVPFPHILHYVRMFYDESGEFILLEGDEWEPLNAALRLSDGALLDPPPEMPWRWLAHPVEDHGGVELTSPDGVLHYRGSYTYQEYYDEDYEQWYMSDTEIAVSQITSTQAGGHITTLKDEPPTLYIQQYWVPQGCDVRFFSFCGNAYAPHGSVPLQAQFSADSQLLAVAYEPFVSGPWRTLRLYRAHDGALLSTFGRFNHPVQAFSFSPDDQVLLVAYQDGAINLYDLTSRQVTFTAHHFNGPLDHIELSFDGQYLLLYRSGMMEVRSTRNGARLWSAPSVMFQASPVENIVAAGAADGTLQLRRIDSGQVLHELKGHRAAIYALDFSPDGRSLASSSDDCTIRLWDVRTGQFQHYFAEVWLDPAGETERASRIFARYLEILPEQKILVGYGSWGTMVSWDLISGKQNYYVESQRLEFYNGMMTLDPHYPESFWVDSSEGRFYINSLGFDLFSGEMLGPLPARDKPEQDCSRYGETTTDGRLMFTRGFGDLEGRICILDAATLQFLDSVQVLPPQSRSSRQSLIWPILSPDGRQLIIPTFEGAIFVYQVVP